VFIIELKTNTLSPCYVLYLKTYSNKKDMHLLKLICLTMGVNVATSSVTFDVLSTLYLPYAYTPQPQYALEKDAAEQMAYDAENSILYSVGKYFL